MPAKIPLLRFDHKKSFSLVTLILLAFASCWSGFASTIYYDSFETYPQQNPAPNPLTNGPAGGQWFFVNPFPPLTVNEHRITESFVAGGALNSRCWYTATNNALLTNAISLAGLTGGTNLYTFHLSFVMASDTFTAGRNTTFAYGIGSSAGTLTFLSGGNLDNSQTFADLNGTSLASSGSTGKSPDRQFQITFQAANLTSADKIYLQFARITNDAGAVLGLLMDDVRLTVDDGSKPQVASVTPVLSLEHVHVSFSEPVDPATATNVANYSFTGGPLPVLGAALIDPTTVELYTGDQTPGATYTAQISGVLAQTGISMVATQLNFTALTLGISPVRYDAGTTVTQPSGPPDPATAAGGFWTPLVNTNLGMSAGPISDDNSTGYNAWNVTDQNVLSSGGSLNYTLPIDQPSDNLARSNGWRIVLRSRLVDNFGSTAADQICSYSDNTLSLRFGLFFGVNTSGYLFATVLGGNTYNLTTDLNSYHTHVLAYDAHSASASYYFDGQLIVSNYPGQSVGGVNGISFGSANSAGAGAMNYNLVQMDVVGGQQPVVTLNPSSTTNGVGQKVTFTAGFSPFVNGYQWLSNSVVIPGATANTYTTAFITTDYNGAKYSCRALSAFGNVETAPAVLTVTSDVTPPFVAAIKASLVAGHVIITYSEPVQPSYATNIANYVRTGATISNATAILLDPLTVELVAAPLTNANYYTLKINNVRDTSNLIIATNSLSTFFDPPLLSLYSYNAGDATNEPSGPPEPTSITGGAWNLRLDADPDLSTNAVVNDNGLGLNAWQVRDASTVFGDYVYYTEPVAADVFPNIFNSGWLLTIRCRLPESFQAPGALFAQFADANNNRYGLSFTLDSSDNLIVGNSMGNAFVNQTVLADGSGLNEYHTHQIYYNPRSTNASYYFDGNLMLSGWAFSNIGAATPEGLLWGALSSAGEGTVNVNLIDLSAAPFPFATVTVANDGGLQIAYRGILQSASSLQSPVAWTSVVTNLTTGTNLYSVPAGQTQQFFRSQMP